MVFKKSFTLLVASGTTPVFAFVTIISDNDCLRIYIISISDPAKSFIRRSIFPNFTRKKGAPPFQHVFHHDFRLVVFLENPSSGMLTILKIRKPFNLS